MSFAIKLRTRLLGLTAVLTTAVAAPGCGQGISRDPLPGPPAAPPTPGSTPDGGLPSTPVALDAGAAGAGSPVPSGPALPRDWTMCGELGGVGITALARSADAARVAVGHGNGVVQVRAASDWALLSTFKAADEPISALALTADGAQLAVGTQVIAGPGTGVGVELWRADGVRGRQLRSGRVETLTFAPDGLHLLGLDGAPGTLTVWNATNTRVVVTLPRTLAVAFTPDGRALVVVEDGGPGVRWLDLTGRELHRLTLEERLSHAGLSPGGHLLAGDGAPAGGKSGFHIMGLGEGVPGPGSPPLPTWKYRTAPGALIEPTMLFSEDGDFLVRVAENSLERRSTDPDSPEPGAVLASYPRGWSRLPTLSPDGYTLLAATPEERVVEVELTAGLERRTLTTLGGHVQPVIDLALSPGPGLRLASSSRAGPDPGAVWLWDLPGRKALHGFAGGQTFTLGTRFSPRADLLAVFGDQVHLLRVDDGSVALRIAFEPRYQPPTFSGHRLAFPPKGQYLANVRYAVSGPSSTRVCESALDQVDTAGFAQQSCSTFLGAHITGSGIDFSPDGSVLVVAGVGAWRTDTREPLWKLPEVPHFPAPGDSLDGWVAFSRDGAQLLVASCPAPPRTCERPGAQVFRTSDGTLVRSVTGGRHPVFSADGSAVLAGDTLTDLATGNTRQLPVTTEISLFLPDQSIVVAEPTGRLRLLCPVP
jgi:WD40 repeat protein